MLRIAIGVAVLVAAAATAALAFERGPARIGFDESVPSDLRSLATETWDEFLAAHPARLSCIEPLTLTADWHLETRAEYQPGSATAVVRVPGTAPNLRHQLIHEFAHHLEFTCADQALLRPSFARAQGFPASAWFDGDSWEETVSEHYAEATVEMVLGRRSHHGNVQISDEAREVVISWARGD